MSMGKDIILSIASMRENGVAFRDISQKVGYSERACERNYRAYQVYGDSYFTDYPWPLNRPKQ